MSDQNRSLLKAIGDRTTLHYNVLLLYRSISSLFSRICLTSCSFPRHRRQGCTRLSNTYQVTIEARIEVAKDWINHELSLRSNIANTIRGNENTLVCNSRKLRSSDAYEYGQIIRYVVLNNALQAYQNC